MCDLEDYQLETSKFGELLADIEVPEPCQTPTNCVFEEYMLQNEIEEESTTSLYVKHAQRINCHGPQQQDDDSKEELDAQFTELFFGKNNREFEQMAQKMIDSVKHETPELDSGSDSGEDPQADDALK